ncbi:MAG: hydrogenase maturation factor, partial [Lachnospiraceae bacterium]|nr:hydrogenase maturation factor [Lachnospiraceae bacterium]
VLPEAALADESDVYMMHDMRNGGIFAALWEISQRIGVGLTIDLKKIPIKQETIEICEFYELNPYVLLSGGGLIMLTENGKALVKKLEENGISAAVIGSTNSSNDKIVMNEEETRYLEPPVPDEIYKVFYNI